MYKLKARKGGCLGSFLIIVVLIVALVVGAVVYALGKTPEELGLGGISLGGDNTVSSVGLGNIKIGKLWTLAKSLGKNAYTFSDEQAPDSETKASADEIAKQWNLGTKGDEIYYGKLFAQFASVCDVGALNLLAPDSYTLTHKQTAYVFDTALKQFYVDSKIITDLAQASGNDSLKDMVVPLQVLQTLDASICALRFVSDGSDITMKLAVSVDISDYIKDVNIPLIQLSDIVYADFDIKASIDDNGDLQGTFSSVSVNGNDRDVSLAALDAVFKLLASDGEPLTTAQISDYATMAVSYLCGRVGCVKDIDVANGTIKFVSTAKFLVE